MPIQFNNITQPLVLAIDTSCDETSVAVTQGTTVLSNIVASQAQLHKQYGGVFPTVAKQAHRENLAPTVAAALKRAGLTLPDIQALAVTQGPGLAPALEVGLEFAKQLAAEHQLPLIPVNHIEGHVVSVLAKPKTQHSQSPALRFPVLSLIISGGHSDFVLVNKIGEYQRLGWTIDDAAGEVLDKVGRMLDLGYPAGPVIEQFAKLGDATTFKFPLPMTTSRDFNLSFSGMKTYSRNLLTKLETENKLDKQTVYDFAASFQKGVFRALTYKLEKLLGAHPEIKAVWLGGGVAANMTLRQSLRQLLKPHGLRLSTPYTKKLCGDNAAMIGVAAGLRWAEGLVPAEPQNIDRRPRWKVDEN
ncbi:MAG TPA: tRNA (adenosine(37)-N6)-threonylcarbamoyltransferase complex transferase subunit TsaD [Vitreimonas sp.]|nr:tRNA (adenosine(37)-N6)-threonylcarbamoyltransferase complex transferase subunit TsaD [Vitreimonas sp.]